jgi:hypothetical protein
MFLLWAATGFVHSCLSPQEGFLHPSKCAVKKRLGFLEHHYKEARICESVNSLADGRRKADRVMQPSSTLASTSGIRRRKADDLVYQAVAAAAMVATLISIWLF